MEKLFIQARYNGEINKEKIDLSALPQKTGLFSSIQYVDFLPVIKEYVEAQGKKAELFKLEDHKGQVLGCSIKKINGVDAILYIGDGMFHPLALGIENSIPIYVFNPLTDEFFTLPEESFEKFRRKQKASMASFFSSKNIGVLVSLKDGQFNIKASEQLKEKYPDKNYYILIFDTLDFSQIENFSFIECFVNTACPRISYDENQKFPRPITEVGLLLNN